MEKTARGRGRPPTGRTAWRKRTLLLTDVEDYQVRAMAAADGRSVAATLRLLVRQASAARRAPGQEVGDE